MIYKLGLQWLHAKSKVEEYKRASCRLEFWRIQSKAWSSSWSPLCPVWIHMRRTKGLKWKAEASALEDQRWYFRWRKRPALFQRNRSRLPFLILFFSIQATSLFVCATHTLGGSADFSKPLQPQKQLCWLSLLGVS